MFNYEVMTEQQAMQERFQLIKDGEYDAVIESAMAKTSSSGNNMIEIEVVVYGFDGVKQNTIKDYLVFSPKMMWKVIHLCKSSGLSKEYEDKMLSEKMLPGKKVRVLVGTKIGEEIPLDKLKGKSPGSKYPDKNEIKDYIEKDKFNENIESYSVNFNDSDIPFSL